MTRTRIRGRETGIALAAAALAMPLAALHAHRAAVPILAAVAIAAVALAWLRDARPPRLGRGFLLLLAALLAWAGLGLAWSIDPGAGLDLLPRVALILLGAGALVAVARDLPPAATEPARRALVLGVAGAALLLALEAATGGVVKALLSDKAQPVVAIKAGSTILVLLAWPALAVLLERRRPIAAGALAAALAVPLACLEGRAALIAAAAGALAFAAAWSFPRATAVALSTAAAAGILAAPWIALDLIQPWFAGEAGEEFLPFSGRHRVEIWRFAAEHVLERPLAGWGFNVSR
ncbi:MAG: hypothetical protein IT561_09745, partial [Alphaproteobacteria bacterium]|nr:hypothetical protein [Alphaproteobacteria bacterium]